MFSGFLRCSRRAACPHSTNRKSVHDFLPSLRKERLRSYQAVRPAIPLSGLPYWCCLQSLPSSRPFRILPSQPSPVRAGCPSVPSDRSALRRGNSRCEYRNLSLRVDDGHFALLHSSYTNSPTHSCAGSRSQPPVCLSHHFRGNLGFRVIDDRVVDLRMTEVLRFTERGGEYHLIGARGA